MNWIRKFGATLSVIRNSKPVKIMELGEIHSHIGRKNHKWIWVAADRNAREYVDFVVGVRSTATGEKLWNRVKERTTGFVTAYYWKSYNEMEPKEQLVKTKKKTYTIEDYKGQIKHVFANKSVILRAWR
jgi:IS1 family transposase